MSQVSRHEQLPGPTVKRSQNPLGPALGGGCPEGLETRQPSSVGRRNGWVVGRLCAVFAMIDQIGGSRQIMSRAPGGEIRKLGATDDEQLGEESGRMGVEMGGYTCLGDGSLFDGMYKVRLPFLSFPSSFLSTASCFAPPCIVIHFPSPFLPLQFCLPHPTRLTTYTSLSSLCSNICVQIYKPPTPSATT